MKEIKRYGLLLAGLACILFFSPDLSGQSTDYPLQSVVDQDQWDAQTIPEEVDLTAQLDHEQDLLENPVNLGEINPLELLRLGMLDRAETDALYQYLLDYGPMASVYELQMVEGLSVEKARELAAYVCVKPAKAKIPSLKELFRFPRLEMMVSGKRILQDRAGYSRDTLVSSPANQYSGSPWQQKINLRASFGKRLQIGFSAKNDAGEQDLSSLKIYSFDDKSFFLGINNMGVLKKLIAGRYGLSFGQGLCLGGGSGLSLGRDNDFRMQSRGLYSSLSANHSNSLNGLALWLKPGPFSLCIFYSKQKLDANLQDTDTITGQNFYTSITEGSYHRTPNENSKKDKVSERDAGMYLTTGGEQWKSGLSLLYHTMDVLPVPDPEPYKYFSSGSNDTWAAWDFLAFLKNFTLFHEFCLGRNGILAGTGGMTFSPAPLVKASVHLSVIPASWNNPHASAGLISTNGAKETGLSTSVQVLLNRYFELKLSTENTRYHWLRYATASPSDKRQHHIILTVHPSKTSQLDAYFKRVEDETDQGTEGKSDTLVHNTRNSFGVLCSYKPDNNFTVKLSARMVQHQTGAGRKAGGWLITHDLGCWPVKKKIKLNAHLAFFDTDTYDERIYAWETDVYRGFSVPAYYNRGYQYAFVLQFRLNRCMDAWIKYSVFNYPGLTSLGSGSDKINGDRKSEVTLQLRAVFR